MKNNYVRQLSWEEVIEANLGDKLSLKDYKWLVEYIKELIRTNGIQFCNTNSGTSKIG